MAKKSVPRRRRPSPLRKTVGIDDQGKLEEATLRRFVFQTFGRARRTQDSPVMPDVWLRYIRIAEKIANTRRGKPPSDVVDLLLTPWSGVRPGDIAKQLRDCLCSPGRISKPTGNTKYNDHSPYDPRLASARIALSDSRVVASVNFDTLVRKVVPLTGWWQRLFRKSDKDEFDYKKVAKRLEEIKREVSNTKKPEGPHIELSRYAALVGFIDRLMAATSRSTIEQLAALAYQLGPPPAANTETEPKEQRRNLTAKEIALLLDLYKRAQDLMTPTETVGAGNFNGVFLISLNRPAGQTLYESRSTVKADAAQRLFDINTTGIVFAVIDGGIDATHPAFVKRSEDGVSKVDPNAPVPEDERLKWSRVSKTYDFTILRDIIAHAGDPRNADGPNGKTIKDLANEHMEAFRHLTIRNNSARDLDWEIVRPLIEVPHNASGTRSYHGPGTDHGTHVAGILAANLPDDENSDRPLIGMCPHLSLLDLRVFDAEGHGDEFAILCALEFVGWLNRDRSNPVVHGVNLSLALAHDVDSFACGQTPICEACNHLVGAGTVVVAAAGNTGFEGGAEKQSFGSGYRPISITDPGNADKVITVGSTHRRDPHLYGVSYFSARGPTGDGRRKPDILAPGEKITSTIRDGGIQRMDGTSMAAPHVSGAAALLMARYPELIGRPAQIKEVLMKTATDLNREPSFQGAGLVDVLRALQSV